MPLKRFPIIASITECLEPSKKPLPWMGGISIDD
jgi:hypothetical protein